MTKVEMGKDIQLIIVASVCNHQTRIHLYHTQENIEERKCRYGSGCTAFKAGLMGPAVRNRASTSRRRHRGECREEPGDTAEADADSKVSPPGDRGGVRAGGTSSRLWLPRKAAWTFVAAPSRPGDSCAALAALGWFPGSSALAGRLRTPVNNFEY